jgi:hypothetical protein
VTSEVLPVRLTPAEREGVNELVRRQLAALHSTGAGITAGSVVRGLIRRELLAQKIEGAIEAPPAPIQQSLFTATAPASAPIAAPVEAAPVEVKPAPVEAAPVEAAPVEAAPVEVEPAPIARPKPKAAKLAPKATPKPKAAKLAPKATPKPKAAKLAPKATPKRAKAPTSKTTRSTPKRRRA